MSTFMNGHSAYIPSGLLVYLFVTSLLNKAKSSRVRKLGPVMIFDATLFTRALLTVGTLGFSIGFIYLLFVSPNEVAAICVFLGLAVIGSVAFPSTISITKEGVQEHRWWGRSTSLNWRDIQRIEYHKGPSTTILLGLGGKKIAHSGFHRDPETFQRECLEHTHLKLVTSSF
jgi:hypothetical protein